jgi:hypothetical protein
LDVDPWDDWLALLATTLAKLADASTRLTPNRIDPRSRSDRSTHGATVGQAADARKGTRFRQDLAVGQAVPGQR